VQPVYNIQAACQGRDLGGVSRDILKIIEKEKKELPRGTTIKVRGQVESMFDSFKALSFGIVFALILVYLLLVVNFQSWLDPLIILMAMPGAFSGILWALFVTQTNFSVPALMGALMCIGVSSANSILMISFANEQMHEGHDPIASALSAGFTRFRPVMMTAGAMIIGMLPMAIGSGEGGSQNAPLGRAVIGGLSVATTSTLLFVPIMFSILKEKYHKAVLPQTNSGDAKEPSTAQSNNQG
jgi:multidrug efflux pump subunit AcrB